MLREILSRKRSGKDCLAQSQLMIVRLSLSATQFCNTKPLLVRFASLDTSQHPRFVHAGTPPNVVSRHRHQSRREVRLHVPSRQYSNNNKMQCDAVLNDVTGPASKRFMIVSRANSTSRGSMFEQARAPTAECQVVSSVALRGPYHT